MRQLIELDRVWRGYEPYELPSKLGLAHAEGVRMHLGGIERRAGTAQFGDVPDSDKVLAVAVAQYPSGEGAFRLTAAKICEYNASSGAWEDISTSTFGTFTADQWAWCSMFQRFYLSPGYVFDSTHNAGIIEQQEFGGTLDYVSDTPGALFLAAYAGRLFAIGTQDNTGTQHLNRIQYSSPGDPTDWDPASGGGYVETIDDGHSPRAAFILGGRLVILRGSLTGGSITYVTATADLNFPLQYETIYGVGLIAPRAWCRIGSDAVMFLAHDDIYLLHGAQVQPVGGPVARKMLEILDPDRIDSALAYYLPAARDVCFLVPEQGTSYLTAFTYNTLTRAWTGPERRYQLTSAAIYHVSDVTTWEDLDTAGTTWEDLDNENRAWGDMTSSSGVPVVLLGTTNGEMWQEADNYTTDTNGAIQTMIETGDYNFAGQKFMIQSSRYPVPAGSTDMKAVDGLLLRYKGKLTPTIYISPDGGQTWKLAWQGELAETSAWTERLIEFPTIVSDRFRVRLVSMAPGDYGSISAPLALQVDLATRMM